MSKGRLLTMCVLIIFGCFFSCSKDSGNSSSPRFHSITYRITSNDYQFFSNVTYTDTVGVPVQSSAVDSTSGWSKSINTRYSQFEVNLQVQGQNSGNNTLNYHLSIYIDGMLQASQQDSAGKFNSFNTRVSALVQ